MTLAAAFDAFKGELELGDKEQSQASKIQQAVRETISKYLYIPDSFLSGSYPRHTKLSPLKDIDVMIVRNATRVPVRTDGQGIHPAQAIAELAQAACWAYPNAEVVPQARSINLQIPSIKFGFDLVPAWLRNPDGYWIPDADSGTWIPTDPDGHASLMTNCNKACENKLKPLIKMAKYWNRNNYDLLRSFHIELICANIFATEKILDYPFGMAAFLVNLQQYIGVAMFDPAYGISRVDKPLSDEEKANLVVRVQYDAQNALDALKLESQGNAEAALEKWKRIFLFGFPN